MLQLDLEEVRGLVLAQLWDVLACAMHVRTCETTVTASLHHRWPYIRGTVGVFVDAQHNIARADSGTQGSWPLYDGQAGCLWGSLRLAVARTLRRHSA